jgi:hypothetical protein
VEGVESLVGCGDERCTNSLEVGRVISPMTLVTSARWCLFDSLYLNIQLYISTNGVAAPYVLVSSYSQISQFGDVISHAELSESVSGQWASRVN